MAKPTYYPDWATEDTTLPSTGQANKVRPKNSLITIGWDKGQIPSAEELNWELNNFGEWIRYLNDEVVPGLADEYLPKTGTKLTFSGDISGTATWNGSETTTVTLSSATLNAATSDPTPNTLVKRNNGGSFGALQNIYGYAPAGQNFDYRIYDQSANNVQKGSFAWDRTGDVITIYKGTPTGKVAEINLFSGRVEITSPRSSSVQGTNGADLTRKDYVDNQDQTYWNNANNTFVAGIRLTQMYSLTIEGGAGNNQLANSGGCCVGWHTEGTEPAGDTIFFRDIQQLIGGNWYTIGQLS